VATPAAVKDFVRLAAAKGLYLDDLIRMAESGMSGRHIAERVLGAQQSGELFPPLKAG
jgi:hypothetical protein